MWVVSEQDKGRFLSYDLIQLRNKLVNDGINSCVAPFFKGVTLPKSENSGIDCVGAKPYTSLRNLRGIRVLPNKLRVAIHTQCLLKAKIGKIPYLT